MNIFWILEGYTLYSFTILRFKHKRIEAFYNTGTTEGIRTTHAQKLKRILSALEGDVSPKDFELSVFLITSAKG
ncbi:MULTISPECIES: hypothetical protein [unclassified Bartonella]|uniref:hypothetical protein n=1 Tax=unclassified Bartonella TaxID=2645622 RepID=UPI0035CF6259